MTSSSMLDNPIWHALQSQHRSFRQEHGLAARYPADITVFVGLAESTSDAFADLAKLVQPGETVALSTAEPLDVPADWEVLRSRQVDQMVCEHLEGPVTTPDLQLEMADVPEMLALAAATEPGPFASGTIKMGRYYGIRSPENGRLAAMAGERLRLTGHTEISAVCTDPAFRGKGLARILVAGLAAKVLAEGSTPFLHVKTENGAKKLYEALGFRVRRAVQLTVIRPSR